MYNRLLKMFASGCQSRIITLNLDLIFVSPKPVYRWKDACPSFHLCTTLMDFAADKWNKWTSAFQGQENNKLVWEQILQVSALQPSPPLSSSFPTHTHRWFLTSRGSTNIRTHSHTYTQSVPFPLTVLSAYRSTIWGCICCVHVCASVSEWVRMWSLTLGTEKSLIIKECLLTHKEQKGEWQKPLHAHPRRAHTQHTHVIHTSVSTNKGPLIVRWIGR